MTAWRNDELDTIGAAEELEIAPRRGDDTLRKPVTIWVVRAGDDLYVRPVNGPGASWYRGVRERHEGWIEASGITRDVSFEEVSSDAAVNHQIDAAYRAKYHRYARSIVESVLTPRARAATLKLTPRG